MSILRLMLLPAGAALLAGCARAPLAAQPETDNAALTVPASLEELPELRGLENVYPVSTAVEGGSELRRTDMLPDFTLPELTAAEKRALGIEDPILDLLRFYAPHAERDGAAERAAGGAAVSRESDVSHAERGAAAGARVDSGYGADSAAVTAGHRGQPSDLTGGAAGHAEREGREGGRGETAQRETRVVDD